jgi:ribosomal protein S18 acetylase RimI-like enzyme
LNTSDAPVAPVTIETVDRPDPGVHIALARLLPQLSATAAPLTREQFEALVDCPATRLLVARSGGAVVGSLTLVFYTLATGVRARIEDVVVDREARGLGIGRGLTAAAVDLATERRARTIDLTSRPDRSEANGLYQAMGFRTRDSAVYRLTL